MNFLAPVRFARWLHEDFSIALQLAQTVHQFPFILHCIISTRSLKRLFAMSFVGRLRATRETIKPSDPWLMPLRSIRGSIGHDGLERIATDAIFERLELPPVKRTPDAAKRLRGLMVELGWTPVRSRHVTSRGRAARVRGYARMLRRPPS
jgi:hypothetical protein